MFIFDLSPNKKNCLPNVSTVSSTVIISGYIIINACMKISPIYACIYYYIATYDDS